MTRALQDASDNDASALAAILSISPVTAIAFGSSHSFRPVAAFEHGTELPGADWPRWVPAALRARA